MCHAVSGEVVLGSDEQITVYTLEVGGDLDLKD